MERATLPELLVLTALLVVGPVGAGLLGPSAVETGEVSVGYGVRVTCDATTA